VLAFHARRVPEPELAAGLTAETFAAALLAVHDPARELECSEAVVRMRVSRALKTLRTAMENKR
jgi:hypothetical protein